MVESIKGKTRFFKSPLFLFSLLFLLFLFCRFLINVDLNMPMNQEECHTGAVARELIDHGIAFPVEQYTPEYYENTILVGSFLSVIPVRLLGLMPISIKLIPFLFSYGCLVIGCLILIKGGFRGGIWFYTVCFFFCSESFINQTLDGVGNHILGEFVGLLLLYFLICWYLSGKPCYFFLWMFFAGLGLFVYMSTALHSTLCILVYVLYKPGPKSWIRRPVPSLKQALFGLFCLAVGVFPFAVFYIKTKSQSILSLTGNSILRRLGSPDIGQAIELIRQSTLNQFRNEAWLPAVFLLLFLIACVWSFSHVKKWSSEESRFIVFVLTVIILPIYSAVIGYGAGEPRYYTYLHPPLYMVGSAVLSVLLEPIFRRGAYVAVILNTALPVIFAVLLLHNIFVVSYSSFHKRYIADKENAYCYWRFGRAFMHYSNRIADENEYATEMKRKCDRFDRQEKRNECYWGWGMLQDLSPEIAKVFGPEGSEIIAMGRGGNYWVEDNITNVCFKGSVTEPYVDKCVLGYIEVMLMERFHRELLLPCADRKRLFIGAIEERRRKIRGGTIGTETAKCKRLNNETCHVIAGYCGAIEDNINLCERMPSAESRSVCRTVYRMTRRSMQIRGQNDYP